MEDGFLPSEQKKSWSHILQEAPFQSASLWCLRTPRSRQANTGHISPLWTHRNPHVHIIIQHLYLHLSGYYSILQQGLSQIGICRNGIIKQVPDDILKTERCNWPPVRQDVISEWTTPVVRVHWSQSLNTAQLHSTWHQTLSLGCCEGLVHLIVLDFRMSSKMLDSLA